MALRVRRSRPVETNMPDNNERGATIPGLAFVLGVLVVAAIVAYLLFGSAFGNGSNVATNTATAAPAEEVGINATRQEAPAQPGQPEAPPAAVPPSPYETPAEPSAEHPSPPPTEADQPPP